MPGAWSKLLDIEEQEDEDVVLKLALAVATTKKKRRIVGQQLPRNALPNVVSHGWIHVICTCWVIEIPFLSDQSYHLFHTLLTVGLPPFGIFNRPSWESGTLQQAQDFRTTREGNVCTHNQYPHVVSVCVRNFEKLRPIATWSDFLRAPLFTDSITDGYGCGYGQMETCQHNLMGAIFFTYTYADADTDTDKRKHSQALMWICLPRPFDYLESTIGVFQGCIQSFKKELCFWPGWGCGKATAVLGIETWNALTGWNNEDLVHMPLITTSLYSSDQWHMD